MMTLPFAIHMAFHTHPSYNTQTNTHTELMYSYCLQIQSLQLRQRENMAKRQKT